MPWALVPVLLLLFPDGQLPSPRWRPLAVVLVGAAVLGAVALAAAAAIRPRTLLTELSTPLPPAADVLLFGRGRRGRASCSWRRSACWRPCWSAGARAVAAGPPPARVPAPDRGAARRRARPGVPDGGARAVAAGRGRAAARADLRGAALPVRRPRPLRPPRLGVDRADRPRRRRLRRHRHRRQRHAGRGDSPWVSLLGAGAVAALLQPAERLAQRGVSRLLYGRRDEPYAVVTELGRHLAPSATRSRCSPGSPAPSWTACGCPTRRSGSPRRTAPPRPSPSRAGGAAHRNGSRWSRTASRSASCSWRRAGRAAAFTGGRDAAAARPRRPGGARGRGVPQRGGPGPGPRPAGARAGGGTPAAAPRPARRRRLRAGRDADAGRGRPPDRAGRRAGAAAARHAVARTSRRAAPRSASLIDGLRPAALDHGLGAGAARAGRAASVRATGPRR